MIERSLDWVQFSAKFSEIQCVEKNYTIVNAIKNYNRAYLTPLGFRINFSNNPKNTPLIFASGEPLQNMRDLDITDSQILRWAIEAGGKFSRIDLAVTEYIEDDFFTMEDVKFWVKEELIESPLIEHGAKAIIDIKPRQEDGLETLYIGDQKKRAKRGIFRAYDKGVEMGIGNDIVSRIELELKRDKAHLSALKIAESGDIGGNFRGRFNVRSKAFERLMDADAVSTKRGLGKMKKEESEKMDGRWTWLINQVAPAIKEAIKADYDAGLGDSRLTQFLYASGLAKEMQAAVIVRSNQMYYNKLASNDVILSDAEEMRKL